MDKYELKKKGFSGIAKQTPLKINGTKNGNTIDKLVSNVNSIGKTHKNIVNGIEITDRRKKLNFDI
jgi:hypothetical protein